MPQLLSKIRCGCARRRHRKVIDGSYCGWDQAVQFLSLTSFPKPLVKLSLQQLLKLMLLLPAGHKRGNVGSGNTKTLKDTTGYLKLQYMKYIT